MYELLDQNTEKFDQLVKKAMSINLSSKNLMVEIDDILKEISCIDISEQRDSSTVFGVLRMLRRMKQEDSNYSVGV